MTSPSVRATPRPAATAPVEAVRSIARVARLLEKASGQLGLSHYRVLSSIAAGEDRASRVAQRFELGRPTISSAVDSLSKAGLVERAVVTTDQRAFELRLTEKGRQVLDAVETEMVSVLDDLYRRLPKPRSNKSPAAIDTLAALGVALDARAAARHPRRS